MNILEKKRILVVEDEPIFRQTLTKPLVTFGAIVETAENGVIAFEVVKTKQFDAIITDIRMPGGDGIMLIKNIRDQIAIKPKIFVCSGFNDLTEQDRVKLGIIAVFEKPFNRKDLLDGMASALQVEGSANDNGAHEQGAA